MFALTVFANTVSAQSFISERTSKSHHGYRMTLGPDGSPKFFEATAQPSLNGFPDAPMSPQAASPYWDNLFPPGPQYDSIIDRSFVRAIAVDDSKDIYIGGSFEYVGNTRVYNVAHFDHTMNMWSVMGDGFGGTVYALAAHNGKLYAGGTFTTVGFNKTNPINFIAVWDGNSWQELGGGLNGPVYSIAFTDSSMIVGGFFSNAGIDSTPLAKTVSNVARWDGHQWDDMGGGLTDQVNTLLASPGGLYAGGNFFDNASNLKGVAKYVSGSWQGIGTGVSGQVSALASLNGNIWIGGTFRRSGDNATVLNSIGVWDGNAINPVGSDPNIGTPYGNIVSMQTVGDTVFIGGFFANIAGVNVHSIAKWYSGTIHPVANGGIYGTVGAFYASDWYGLFVGGVFLQAGNLPCNGLAILLSSNQWKLDNTTPACTGGYLETSVNAVAVNDRYVFVGGYFTTIKSKPMQHIAMFDKVNRVWLPLGKGLDQGVRAMYLQNNKLYVGGGFNYAGDTITNHVAYYDLTMNTWHSMGDGSVRFVEAFTGDGTNIFASSIFDYLSLGYREQIAKWDGSSWTPIPGEINGYVYALASVGPTLFVGGYFDHVNSTKIPFIAAYDGNTWTAVGGGTDYTVSAMLPTGNDLYVAGGFLLAGSDTVRGIARWDGQRWHSLGTGLNSAADALAYNKSGLYVGGHFTQAGGTNASRLANWDGTSWSDVTGGVASTVRALALDTGALYIGGDFTHVDNGTKNSYRFAILHFGSLGVNDKQANYLALQNYPNPFATTTKIEYEVATASTVSIELYNVLGEKMMTVVNEFKSPGTYDAKVNASHLPNGSYLCKYQSGNTIETKQVVVAK